MRPPSRNQTPPPAELLLGRPEFAGDVAQAAGFVHRRRVLITGAAGSIGTPLARALVAAQPDSLILLDHHEHSLFSLERSLGPARADLSYELGDVRDERRLRRLFERHRPEIVVHLAAAKHVPFGERFPDGAVESNVLATRSLLRLSAAIGVEAFIYPSSDKSVLPPSVYGATKRVAEALVQSMAAESGSWIVVRYVNIIGTRGSVIETFTEQIHAERPLSITDERMTRYWIGMDEALWCALVSARCISNGQVVMPACGEPVPIIETARRLAGWYRPERVPYPIVCTGIRPGERLSEVLLSPNESFADAPAPGLRAVHSTRSPARLADVARAVAELEALIARADREGLVRACMAAAEALQ